MKLKEEQSNEVSIKKEAGAVANIDFDVSGTHMGIKTHLATCRLLSESFK